MRPLCTRISAAVHHRREGAGATRRRHRRLTASDPDFRCLVLVPLRPPTPRSLTDGKAVKRLHDLVVNRAQRADKVAHAEAEATLFRLRQLDAALAAVLAEDNLLFDGVTASGRDILEALQRE